MLSLRGAAALVDTQDKHRIFSLLNSLVVRSCLTCSPRSVKSRSTCGGDLSKWGRRWQDPWSNFYGVWKVALPERLTCRMLHFTGYISNSEWQAREAYEDECMRSLSRAQLHPCAFTNDAVLHKFSANHFMTTEYNPGSKARVYK